MANLKIEIMVDCDSLKEFIKQEVEKALTEQRSEVSTLSGNSFEKFEVTYFPAPIKASYFVSSMPKSPEVAKRLEEQAGSAVAKMLENYEREVISRVTGYKEPTLKERLATPEVQQELDQLLEYQKMTDPGKAILDCDFLVSREVVTKETIGVPTNIKYGESTINGVPQNQETWRDRPSML